jgi:DNA polymerase III subunit alpha
VSSRQVGLHVHSEFSTLDGFSTVGDIARRAKELGQSAAALTDHGECAGHYKFQKACQSQGVQPIFGMEGYWHHDIASLREAKRYPKDLSHLCLLAKDQKGLSNLWALSTIAYDRQHHYYRPIADPELLRTYAEGIYASDGCMMTGLGRAVEASDEDGVRRYITTLLDIFGDRFYIELHTWQFMEATTDEQRRLNQLMTDINTAKLRMANQLGVPFVVVNDCHHSWPQDWRKKDLANQINKDKGDQVAEGQKADHHMGEDELFSWMARHGINRSVVEQGIDNAWEIAQSCTAEITPMLEMPTYAKDVDEDAQRFLAAVEKGFQDKVLKAGLDGEKYYQRLEFEAREILSRQFGGYFLTVADYVRAAKDGSWKTWVNPGADPEPVLTGPGRGSAGGSLVSWLMGITGLDPIKYDLLFERFLAPGRKGFPDIDVDFPQSKLRDMFHYLEARHGEGHVCTLSTTGRNGAKGMLKDLGRAMGIPFSDTNQITNIIEQAAAIVAAERENLDEDAAEDPAWDEVLSTKGGDLAPWAKKYPEMFEQLGEMVGVVRNYGKHASGVLINNQPLLGTIPMRTRNHGAADEIVTTQWDMYDIEELGGVKFDLLGLRHLDTLGSAVNLVAQRHGTTLDFESFGDEQYSDPAIWEHIAEGRTTGIFQIETPGTTRTAVEMKPLNELDVAALVSIIRPGVKDAGETDRYLKRRAGIEPVVYDHPMLEPIVSETYGVLVYQEQMMRAAKDLAGYDPGEVDDLRKAIGKKLADKIAVHESKFRDGCLDNPAFMESFDGNTRAAEKTVSKIWASINASGKYAFNKSHAVGYGLVSVWETWLAHHYPNEYIVELMATDSKNINRYVRLARRRGIPILPPDVNISDQKFTIGPDGIRYGLDTIRGVGASAVRDILAKRPFTSLADYLERVDPRLGGGKTVVANLISIGAFDTLEYNPAIDSKWAPSCRSRLMQEFHEHRVWTKRVSPNVRARMDAQQRAEHLAKWFDKHRTDTDFDKEFGVPNFDDSDVVYRIEQELVGNYVLVDPMAPYLSALDELALRDPAQINDFTIGEVFVIGGQVSKIKQITTKRGKEMAFLTVTYNEAEFEITVFPENWSASKLLLREGAPVACTVLRDERGCHLASLERLDILWKAAS